MIPYIIVFIVLFFLSVASEACKSSSPKFYLGVASALFVTVFYGLRWETGTDWSSYLEIFSRIQESSGIDFFSDRAFERGYLMFVQISRCLSDSFVIHNLLIAALASLFFLLASMNYVQNISLCFFSSYSSFGLINFMGSVRRGLAISLVLYSTSLIFKLKNTKVILQSPVLDTRKSLWLKTKQMFVMVIASLFHRSSLISIPILFISHRPIKKPLKILLFFLIAMAIGLFLSNYLSTVFPLLFSLFSNSPVINKIAFYTEHGYIADGYNPEKYLLLSLAKRTIIVAATFLSLLIISREHPPKQKDPFLANKLSFLGIIYIVGLLGYLFLSQIPVFQIMTVPYAMSECFLLPLMISPFRANTRILLVLAASLYLLPQLLSSINVLPESFIPYNNVLF